jgi:SsrA-binding protein
MKSEQNERRQVAQNRKAYHQYHIIDELEVGLSLVGSEVKSLRAGQCSLQEAWVKISREEMYLVGAHIPEYVHANALNHKPTRERKLLAHRREIGAWSKQVREKGTTIVPLEVYFVGQRAKVLLGLSKGKKQHDKRQSVKERDDKREMAREQKRRRQS